MANLSFKEKSTLEELFEMSGGYVIDFSNNSFARFVGDSINIDIYNGLGYEEYCSKANKLRQIWADEPDSVVGQLLSDLLSHFEDFQLKRNGNLTDYEAKKIGEMRLASQRLFGNQVKIELPDIKEDTLQTLMDDINNSLARNKPTLVLDRLHTFSTKLLRQICIDNKINVVNDKGDYLPLHSLAGMLKKYYEQNNVFQSDFTVLAIQNNIALFDKYNSIRNNQSYAHDNEVLDTIEAEFAVKAMANVITFIDRVERFRKKQIVHEDLELPF